MSESTEHKVTWFKDNWTTILGWALFVGVSYGVYTTNNKWIEARLNRLEQLNLEEVKFRQNDNTVKIAQLELESKVQREVQSDMKAKIDVINTKLDTITDLLKKAQK